MSGHRQILILIVLLLMVPGCGGDEEATTEGTSAATTVASTAAATSTNATTAPAESAATTTTEVVTTTTEAAAATGAGPVVNMALAPAFVAHVREGWDRIERTVGGTAPGLTDDEITTIGVSICDHLAANPLPPERADEQRMEAFAGVAALIAEAMGIPYDPALQDAGFETGIDARNVIVFNQVADESGDALCPVPTLGEGALECSQYKCRLFWAPWSSRASDTDD